MGDMNTLQIIQSVTCIIYYIVVGGIAVYGVVQYEGWKIPERYKKLEIIHKKYSECFILIKDYADFICEIESEVLIDKNGKTKFDILDQECEFLNAEMSGMFKMVNLYFNKKEHFETQTSIIKAGFITISLLFSRLFTIIPLILVLSKKFIIWDFRKKTTFSVTILAVASICLYIVLHAVPNLNTLLKNNPLELQNRQNPLLLSIIFITIPLIYSQYVKSGIGLLYSSIFFLCIPILSSFLIRLTKMGWQETIYESGTDISYFNILLPLIIFAIALNPKKASEL